jgi:hypothetical protein
MNPRVVNVKPLPNYQLFLEFEGNINRVFDVKPYLEIGIFKQLKSESLFNAVRANLGTVQWNDEIDFCPDTLYLDSKDVD